jgi:hypothetical protein
MDGKPGWHSVGVAPPISTVHIRQKEERILNPRSKDFMMRLASRPLALATVLLLSGCGDLLTPASTLEVPQPGTYLLTSFDLRPLPDSARACTSCEWFVILPDTLFIAANLAVDWRLSWDPGAGDPQRDILIGSVVQLGSSTLSISGNLSSQPTNSFPHMVRIHYSRGDSLVLVGGMPWDRGINHTLGFRRKP